MRYLSKEWVDRMEKGGMGLPLRPDPRAERLDEVFYEEVLAGKQWGLVEILRKAYATPQEEVIEWIIKSRQHAVELGLIDQAEADEGIARAKAQHVERPPFNEEQIIRNFKNSLKEMEANYRQNLPKEILCRIADPRMLALGFATPEVIEAITAWSNENSRIADEIRYASYAQTEKAKATLPWRTARLLRLHDARVEQAEREGDVLTLFIDAKRDNYYHVRFVRFTRCEITKWEDPSSAFWLYEEMEHLPDDRYSIYLLFRGQDSLKEVELTARDILVECPTTEEDMRAEDERILRRIERNANRKVTEGKPEIH